MMRTVMASFEEILEKALKGARAAVGNTDRPLEFDSDEELEAALRRELIKIARSNGVSDPEILRILFWRGYRIADAILPMAPSLDTRSLFLDPGYPAPIPNFPCFRN